MERICLYCNMNLTPTTFLNVFFKTYILQIIYIPEASQGLPLFLVSPKLSDRFRLRAPVTFANSSATREGWEDTNLDQLCKAMTSLEWLLMNSRHPSFRPTAGTSCASMRRSTALETESWEMRNFSQITSSLFIPQLCANLSKFSPYEERSDR